MEVTFKHWSDCFSDGTVITRNTIAKIVEQAMVLEIGRLAFSIDVEGAKACVVVGSVTELK